MDIPALHQHFLAHPQVSTDSRNIMPGCIFFGIKGPNFDGNSFARQALAQGASLAVVDDPVYYGIEGILVCENSLETLQQLAAWHRRQYNIPVIGITGSNGKTTTKELVKTVLESKFRTLYTRGNLNNHIGVPLTLLSISSETEVAVIEMGANHPGEIAELCDIAGPTLGILTNIGKAHLGGFGGLDGVIRTKKALYDAVKSTEGTVFVNAGNPLLMELSAGMNRWTFGQDEGVNTLCTAYRAEPELSVAYAHRGRHYEIQTQLLGDYNYENVMAAVCTGLYMGIEPDILNRALSAYVPANNRSQLVRTAQNTIFLDAYNANPSSMRAAIDNFYKINAKRKALILGDMLELGDDSDLEHESLIRYIDSLGFTEVILIGPSFVKVRQQGHYPAFDDAAAALAHLKNNPYSDTHVLLKGSRGLAVEIMMEAL